MPTRTTANRPNVLVIMSDQHNKFVMGHEGATIVRTKNLDRLADEGMRFTDFYSPAPLCVPARACFLTSRRVIKTGIWFNGIMLDSSIPTWAHALGIAGYETALLGRMHFQGPDQRHGFELRPYGDMQGTYYGAPYRGGDIFRECKGMTGQGRLCDHDGAKGSSPFEHFDRHTSEAVCRYLHEKAHRKDSRPFAAVVGYYLPHCPYVGNPDYFDYYFKNAPVPTVTQEYIDQLPENVKGYMRLRNQDTPINPRYIRASRAAYFAMVQAMDDHIGMILAVLNRTGLADNTIVVYTSDHGDMINDHGLWTKGNFYEGSAGLPMLVRWPGVVKPGATCPAVSSLLDLGVTLADIAGAPPMPCTDGRTLRPWLEGKRPAGWKDEIISEVVGRSDEVPAHMIRRGPWKLWDYADDTPPAMFNLATDPREEHDLAAAGEFAAIRDQMLATLNKGWDPKGIWEHLKSCRRDIAYVAQWGQTVKPIHEDCAPVPDEPQVFIPANQPEPRKVPIKRGVKS